MPNGTTIKGDRRHDIFDKNTRKGIELKDYKADNVAASQAILREALMDIQLLKDGKIKDMDWVFLGKGPTGPLETLLRTSIKKQDGTYTTLLK